MKHDKNPYIAVREWADDFNRFSLEDAHVRDLLKNTLYLEHHDGHIIQHNAFYIEKEFFGTKFFVLFGEHLKPDIHAADEVLAIAMFEMRHPCNEGDADDDDDDITSEIDDGPEPYVICPRCRNWAAFPDEVCKECHKNATNQPL